MWPLSEIDCVFNINTNQPSINHTNPSPLWSGMDNILVWDLDERAKTRRRNRGNNKQMCSMDPRLTRSSISFSAMYSHSPIEFQIPERNMLTSCEHVFVAFLKDTFITIDWWSQGKGHSIKLSIVFIVDVEDSSSSACFALAAYTSVLCSLHINTAVDTHGLHMVPTLVSGVWH